MKIIFINYRKYSRYVETLEMLKQDPTQDLKEFEMFVDQKLYEYRLAGFPAYRSNRPSSDWK